MRNEKEQHPPSTLAAGSVPPPKRLTDRIAQVERVILDSKESGEYEREIFWRLLGTISYWARPDNEHCKEAAKAKWLMTEIEDLVYLRLARQNNKLSGGSEPRP